MYRDNHDPGASLVGGLIAAGIFALVACIPFCGGCDVSRDDAAEVLEPMGFTNVETHGHAWFDCGEGDTFSSEFTATSLNGQEVEGSICCGWLKSCTVRW